MKNTGQRIPVRFDWKAWTPTHDNVFNGETPVWADGSTRLWGWVEDMSADEQLIFSGRYGATDSKIHLTNFPNVQTYDLLKDSRFSEVYHVKGRTYGNNELILYVQRIKDTWNAYG